MPNITPNTFWPNMQWPSGGSVTGGGGGGGGGYTAPSHTVKFRLWSTAQATSTDYVPYLYSAPLKTDRINEPDYMDFSLVPWDTAFVKLARGNYMQFDTGSFNTWFTGFVTNDPELEQLGVQNGQAVYGYKYEIASEDYLLNLKPIGIIPPFLNTTQGEILIQLIALLAPEFNFDVTNIQPGLSISRYIVDPQKKFTDIVKEFCDGAYFRWSCRAGKLSFVQQDATPANLIIDGSNQHFTPSNFSIQPAKDPIINDAIVLGDIEPQGYIVEYFVGNGFQKKFSLISSVYGADSSVLLDDDFQNSEIDSSKWDVFDDPQNFIQLFNGYVNCLGGRNDGSYGVYLQSANLVPLEGHMRITHGEWDFVQQSDGIIGGLWTDTPQPNFSNCVYGIRVWKNGTSTTLQPIYNGTVDSTQSHSFTSYNYRYIMRTTYSFQRQHRVTQNYAWMDANGAIQFSTPSQVSDAVTADTWISVVDPQTTNVVETIHWSNVFSVSSSVNFAYYDPAVLNDLHATFTGITISTPLQARLLLEKWGTSQWVTQLVGPNEMDSFDGMTPVATIVDANQGWTTKSSKLGRKQYNPGNAALEYFADPTKTNDDQYAPPLGSWIRLDYRRAGAAMARVRDAASVATESSAWGDSGIRSVTRQDLQPPPRNSAECEYAAQAIVNDFSRQHWDGSYKQVSTYEFTGEPLSGTVLTFQNMPSGYPTSLTAETIQEVQTTFIAGFPNEIFQHDIKFGRKDALKKQLAAFTKKVDVFQPQDTAEIPDALSVDVIGTAFAPDTVQPDFVNWDHNNLYFDAKQAPPSGGGFEVRYSDESWGADDSKNLALRTGPFSQTFSVPRTLRSRVIFIRAYDQRNMVWWSEDLTTSLWGPGSGTVVTNAMSYNPDDAKSLISTITFGAGATVQQVTQGKRSAGQVVASFSLEAADPTQVGQQVSLQLQNNTGQVLSSTLATLTVGWKRYSVAYTDAVNDGTQYYLVLSSTAGVKCKATRASLEVGRLTESVYAKTTGGTYGALSRWSTGIATHLPLIPPAPTATIDASNITKPIVNITLPAAQQDVWGVEVRASDNVTILYRSALVDTGATLSPQITGNQTRNLLYYVYTYNILNEYSPSFAATATIPTPQITNLYVDDGARTVHWQGIGSTSFLVEIDATDSNMSHVYWQNMQSANSLWLNDTEFFPQRWIGVTPFDDLGAGFPSVVSHSYAAAAVVTWDNTVATSVPAPPTPAVDVTPPPTAAKWAREYVGDSWGNYSRNRFRYF